MREMKAVGRRCTKAVAIKTPVPKCLERKRNWWGTGNRGKRLATMGKEQAVRVQCAVPLPLVHGQNTYRPYSQRVSAPVQRHGGACCSSHGCPWSRTPDALRLVGGVALRAADGWVCWPTACLDMFSNAALLHIRIEEGAHHPVHPPSLWIGRGSRRRPR